MNALLLPLLLAAAPAPIEPTPTEVVPIELSAMEGCGGSGPVFADRSPLVDAASLASVDAGAAPVAAAGPATVEPVSANQDVLEPAVTGAATRVHARRDDRRCLADTGSRIRGAARRCDARAGDAYDRDDIDRTGAVTTAEALRRLNPAVTIR